MDKYTICQDSPLASGALAPISKTGASSTMLSAVAATATRAASSTVPSSDGQLPVAEGVVHASAPRQPLTIPHHVVLWPNVSAHLATGGGATASLVSQVLEEGPAWFLRHELAKHPKPLPSGVGLPYIPFNPQAVGVCQSPAVTFPFLSIQQMMSYSQTYFNTFDMLDPILDQEHFRHGTMARLLREGYVEGDPSAVLALLVFALAEVAIAGINAQPLGESETYPSRFQSGAAEQPPGLALFNEARRRLAFIRTYGSLEHVQILLLQATYYEASARHLDYWNSTIAASMACQLVIKSSNVDWTTAYGDLVSRAFWSCLIKEDLFHLDLDLPRTGIADLHERVPYPHFRSAEMGKDSDPRNLHRSFDGKQEKHYASFLALIALRSLISSIGTAVEEAHTAPHIPSECPIPSVAVVRELLSQLDQWRALLPSSLQWKDSDSFDFAEPATQHCNHS
ncbi:hypothetical protein D0861_03584 [Hortaea werneckii]|uniref:Xylanolytic transcriptional activator regulatory domain-containing protein n=1 Tax=Hortaea werneckii TaxID=91943 RepID=A0A3M7FNZ0_HORWE|nr:hypothetical protein D0861_03584 [Hortaea werneckii]